MASREGRVIAVLVFAVLASGFGARPAAADETFHLFPETADPARMVPLPPYPTERRFGLAAAEVVAFNILPWAFNRYVIEAEYAYISTAAVRYNRQTGYAYDRDSFTTNQFSHPFHGSLYYSSARSNGFTFWESGAFTLFGSLLWEMYLENEPPAIHDLVNTALGGMSRGEIQHRLSNMILDNTKSGFERFLREATGFVLNPVGGINRLLKGETWNDYQNPSDRFPSRFYLELDGFYQHRAGSAVEGVDTNQGGISILMRYGDPFDGEHRVPFEYFDWAIDFTWPASVVVSRLDSRGLLRDWILSDGGGPDQRFGLFLDFDYRYDAPWTFGAQTFSAAHLMRIPLGAGTDLRTDLALRGMPMAAVGVDYYGVAWNSGIGRNYDYGPAGGARARVELRRRGLDLLALEYSLVLQRPSNGLARNNRLQTFAAEGRLPLGNTFAIGAGWGWADRLSTYKDADLPTVNVGSTTWRAFAAWRWQDAWATTAPAAPSSPAFGESKGRWELTAFGGGFLGTRVYTSEEVNVMTATAPVYGVRVGYGLTRVFTLEAGWSHASTHLEPRNPETDERAGADSPLTMNTWELEGLFNIGSGPLVGYLGIGAGVMTLSPNVPSLDHTGGTSAFEANIAAGGKYFFTDSFAFRADARYRWRTGDNRLATTVCGSLGCKPFDTNLYSSVELTGGLTLRF
jgi:hypothetical protein